MKKLKEIIGENDGVLPYWCIEQGFIAFTGKKKIEMLIEDLQNLPEIDDKLQLIIDKCKYFKDEDFSEKEEDEMFSEIRQDLIKYNDQKEAK